MQPASVHPVVTHRMKHSTENATKNPAGKTLHRKATSALRVRSMLSTECTSCGSKKGEVRFPLERDAWSLKQRVKRLLLEWCFVIVTSSSDVWVAWVISKLEYVVSPWSAAQQRKEREVIYAKEGDSIRNTI
jgi:hypothetical protein